MGSRRLNRSWIMVLGGKEVLSSPDKRFLCYSTFSCRVRVLFCVRWMQYWSAQGVPAVCCAGTGGGGSRWFKVGGQRLCTKVEPQGLSSPAWDLRKVYDLLLALLWGHLRFPGRGAGARHTTPAGGQRLEASKDMGSQGTVHKMTIRVSYLECMGGGGGEGWDNNLERSLESNLVMTEPFICVGLQERSQFPIFQELPTCHVEWFSTISSLMVPPASVVGWGAWSPYTWRPETASEWYSRQVFGC